MKILIVKTSSLGDIIHTFPALTYLRQKFPKAQIDWVVEKKCAELVEAHPFVDNAIIMDSKQLRWNSLRQLYSSLLQNHYDLLFDFQANIKSAVITTLAKAHTKVGFGWKTAREKLNTVSTHVRFNPPNHYNIREDNLYLPQSYFNDFTSSLESVQLRLIPAKQIELDLILNKLPNHCVMVCSGSAWPNKQLSKETLLNFLKLLQGQRGCHFVFIHGNNEEEKDAQLLQSTFSQTSILLERVSIPVLQNLMGRMSLVIAMDSLPLHLAGTTSTPTFSVFGASSAIKFQPKGPQHHAFQGKCPYSKTFEKRCPILRSCSTGACIKGISAEMLLQALNANTNMPHRL